MNSLSEEILEFLNKGNIPKNIKSKNLNLYSEIFNMTSFFPPNIKLGERIYCILNDISFIKLCKECNKNSVKFLGKSLGYRDFCSTKCSNSNNITMKKRKQTNYMKLGVDFPSQNLQIKKKMEETTFKRFGVRYSQQSKRVLLKTIETNRSKYGTDTFFQSERFKQKQKQTCIKKYGVNSPKQKHITEDTWNKINDPVWLEKENKENGKKLIQISEDLGVSVALISHYFQKYNITPYYYTGQSESEKEIIEFLRSIGVKVEKKNRTLCKPKEIDIVLPEFKLGIEFCGLYWHADIHDKMYPNYHLDKLEQCNIKEYELITLFEDEWLENKEIIKRFLLYKTKRMKEKVYARNCYITPTVSRKQKKEFFNTYHIQGNGGGSITYSLQNDENIAAMMTFIKRKNGIFELNRYATSKIVVGGFSKLLSYFKKNNKWNKIVSFADRRISNGDVYLKSGFELMNVSSPGYFYIVKNKRFHRRNFMKKYLPNKLKNFDPDLTEFENCDNNNILRIWDCGQLKFEMVNG